MVLLVASVLGGEHFRGYSFYAGDLHVHTGISGDGQSADLENCRAESCGNAYEVVQHARDEGLDFVSITDHVNNLLAGEPEVQVVAGNDPGDGFVTIPGAEVHFTLWNDSPLGHKNLYFFGDDATLAGLTMDDTRFDGDSAKWDACEHIWAWTDQLQKDWGDVALVPHHTAGISPMVTWWECHDPRYQLAAETYSEHGNSLRADGWDLPASEAVETGWIHHALDPDGLAHQLAFFGSTDTHDSWPGQTCAYSLEGYYGGGLAMVVLDEGDTFDRAAIYDAIVDRRTYSTSGLKVPVIVSWHNEGVEVGGLGDHVEVVEGTPLEVQVELPSDAVPWVLGVDLVTPDEDLLLSVDGQKWSLSVDDVPAWAYVRVRFEGAAYYGPEGCRDGGADTQERIWMSPSWFTLVEAPPEDTSPPEVVDTSPPGQVDSDPQVDTSPPEVEDTSPPPENPDRKEPDGGHYTPIEITPTGCGCGGGGLAGLWLLAVPLIRRRSTARAAPRSAR